MLGGKQSIGWRWRLWLAAGLLGPCPQLADAAIGIAEVGAVIVVPIRLADPSVGPASARMADGSPSNLVIAVSSEAASTAVSRVTYAFN